MPDPIYVGNFFAPQPQETGPDSEVMPPDLPLLPDRGYATPNYPYFPDPSGLYSDWADNASADQKGEAPYTQFLADAKFILNPGAKQSPVAGPDGTAAEIVKVAAYSCVLEVLWTAERRDDWPNVPTWEIADSNRSLLDGSWIKPCNPLDGPNGLKVYRVEGFYRIGYRVPPRAADGLAVFNNPVNNDGPVMLPGAKIVTGML